MKTLNRVVIQDGPHAGMDEQVLVHTRSIGDLTYTVKKISELSDPGNEAVSDHDWSEAFTFQEKWDKNWNPSLGQEEWVKGFLTASFAAVLYVAFLSFKKMLGI